MQLGIIVTCIHSIFVVDESRDGSIIRRCNVVLRIVGDRNGDTNSYLFDWEKIRARRFREAEGCVEWNIGRNSTWMGHPIGATILSISSSTCCRYIHLL